MQLGDKIVHAPDLVANNGGTAGGQWTTVAAADTIDTGLKQVLSAVAVPGEDSTLALNEVSVTIGTGANAGKITIKTWKATGAGDGTPIAATAFSKKVNWMAIGIAG